MASYYLKAAASYLDRSNISTSYTAVPNPATVTTSVGSISPNAQSGSSPSASVSNWSPPVRIGLWNVTRATHNSTNKLVSVWNFEKKIDSSGTGGGGSSGWGGGGTSSKTPLEKVIDILKKEASSLSRLRHPCILEVVEPLEETRTTMVFATEPVTACLKDAIEQNSTGSSSRYSSERGRVHATLELDEVETQKGLLQIGKGLQFLHESAKLVHSNLTPDSIIINAKGDWKISGFGLSTYLKQPDGQDSRWSFPEFDHRLPDVIQKNFDYIAPEYCLDEHLTIGNDMYSLGCILHSIHTRSGPPFRNNNNLETMRKNVENMGVLRAAWTRVPEDVQEVLSQLLTRTPMTRLTAASFLISRYFSSNVLVSTLAFLDRDTFNSNPKEQQIQFMKGLLRVLPQFSSKVIKRKILPSLVEETRKHNLLPFLLPNIFYIANEMDVEEFRTELLPHLTPLFSIKEPPQSILTLLDNLSIFQTKSTPHVFREQVMPLIYFALESDVPALQEKALKVIPGLCETLDYTHVKQVLFPKVTTIFSKTTLLSVKVNTLICFHSMVNILDKYTLTEKLVPLLAKIKTKEPAVMIATLAVHEEMGKKVELSAIATLILPQLWAMSIGPLLNLDQFRRFMSSIDQLANRVREEHTRHLVEAKRLEESTARSQSTSHLSQQMQGDEVVDFETLVKGGAPRGSLSREPGTATAPISPTTSAWGFDDTPAPTLTSSVSSLPNWGSSLVPPPRTSNTPNGLSSASANPSLTKSLAPPLSFGATSAGAMMTSLQTPGQQLGIQPSQGLLPPMKPSNYMTSTTSSMADSSSSQFMGLPPLKPQTSSLSQLVNNSTSSISLPPPKSQPPPNLINPTWNVIAPMKNHLPNSNNKPQKSSSRAALADFDPFA